MEGREFYETGLRDMYTNKINEGDTIVVHGMVKEWVGQVLFRNAQFIVMYEDDTEDPLSEVNEQCQVTLAYAHISFRDILKRKIKQLEIDLINTINEQV